METFDTNHDIVKSNALIKAVYSPGSVYQMRLLMAALLQIKAKEEIDYKKRYYVSADTLSRLTGAKTVDNYKELKRAADELMDKTVMLFEYPNGDALPNPVRVNLVSSCEYIKKEGHVGLRFTDEITPYISELRTRFTKYRAQNVMPMKSSYGIRLYELCLQHLGEELEYSVDEFRRLFDLETKYKNVAELKRNVITPALNDINICSDIRVHFGQRKAGRRVSHLQFGITKPTAKLATLSHREWVDKFKMAKRGEEWDEVLKRTRNEYGKYKKAPSDWVPPDQAKREKLEALGQTRITGTT